MRTWTRADGPKICGACKGEKGQIVTGDPMQVIELAGVEQKRVRCRHCAEGEPPPDLPPVVEKSIPVPVTPKSFARFGASALPFDFRMAAAGVSREPGEDD